MEWLRQTFIEGRALFITWLMRKYSFCECSKCGHTELGDIECDQCSRCGGYMNRQFIK